MKHVVLGLFAPVDAGKTTLCEAMLFEAGQLKKLGRVDHGNAFLDTHSIERSRGITIFSKQARFRTENLSVTLLDTPGHIDFSPEAERVMPVLDYALLIINASDGVTPYAQTLWKLLRHYHIPTVLFFNKMDLPETDRVRLLEQAKAQLSQNCAELDDAESVALCDEAVLDRYLQTGALAQDDIAGMIQKEVFFPCFFGSALRAHGVAELLDALQSCTIGRIYPDTFSARVYKIAYDAQGNRLTFLKVTGGTLRVRSMIGEEKITQLRLYSGANYVQTDEVSAGNVCTALGLSALAIGDTVGAEDATPLPFLCPVMTYRIALPDGIQPHVALSKLRQLEEEDPQLHIVWDERLQEIHIQIMGQVQLEVLKVLIAERFDLQVDIDRGRVSYRETIRNTVEGVGHFEPLRHYAEVHLILQPLPTGSGLQFDTECSEDVLDRNWQRLILAHLREKTHVGVLIGAPITDVKITLAAGRAHIKHTEGGDFRQATYRAVRHGLMRAESVLLEPYYRFTLSVPSGQIGRAINDIRLMGGSFAPPTDEGENMVLQGTAPVSGMQEYLSEVISYTRGKGRLSCEFDGYAPCHNAEKVIAENDYDPLSDTENPPGSVFCSHGAGIHINWDEVTEHMHLQSVLQPVRTHTPQIVRHNLDLDEKELQAIIEREFGPEKRVLHRPPIVAGSAQTEISPRKQEYLIVDGYNMIFAWDGLREQAQTDIAGARQRLLDILSNYCGYHPCQLVVVFDSYRVKGGIGSKMRHNNLRVVYTHEHESADLYIESLVAEIGRNYSIRVATSDALIQLSALRSGVLRVSAGELLREIEAVDQKIAALLASLCEESKRARIRENPLRNL